MRKKIIIIAVCLVIGAALLIRFFPTIFWRIHNYNTARLQGRLIEGKNDIEYAYGKDLVSGVKEEHAEVHEGGATEYLFLYPEELETANSVYPVVVWGNGTANTYENYRASLTSLASYGFIVVGCNDSNMGDGRTLYEMGRYVRELNEDPGSLFYGKIDTDNIGAAGHSQGACGAVNAATRYEESQTLFKSLYTTSMPKLSMCVDGKDWQFAYWQYDVSKIEVPYFATTGTLFLDSFWISPLSAMKENFANLTGKAPAYMARQKGANHNIVNEFHGSGYFNAWFCYTLKGDETAGAAFVGEAEIGRNKGRWKDFEALHP